MALTMDPSHIPQNKDPVPMLQPLRNIQEKGEDPKCGTKKQLPI